MTIEDDFVECEECRKIPGSPVLCRSCLHNRTLIRKNQQLIGDLKEACEMHLKDADQCWRDNLALDQALKAEKAKLTTAQKSNVSLVRQIEEQRERHAAELATIRKNHQDSLSTLRQSCDDEKDASLASECKLYDAQLKDQLTAADQRWQERLRAVEREDERRIKELRTTCENERQCAAAELAMEKANWKAHLERVEAEKKMFSDLSEKLTETVKQVCESRTKAVAAAYEEAAKIANPCHYGFSAARAIREYASQLAAKPQEAGQYLAHDAPTASKKPKTCFACGAVVNPNCYWQTNGQAFCSDECAETAKKPYQKPEVTEHPFDGLAWGRRLRAFPVFTVDVTGCLE